MRRRIPYLAILFVLVFLANIRAAPAADLKDFYPSLAAQAQTEVGVFLTGSSLSGSNQFLATFESGAALVQFSSQIADQFNYYPVGSTVAAFTYKFDPNLNVFERSTDGLGPLFSERGQTVGKGKLNIAFGYSSIDYDVFQGQNLGNYNLTKGNAPVIVIPPSTTTIPPTPPPIAGRPFVPPPFPHVSFTGSIFLGKNLIHFVIPPCGLITCPASGGFPATGPPGTYTLGASIPNVTLDTDIHTDVYALFVNYGVTDKLDVGIVVPYLATWLKGSVQADGLINPTTGNTFSVRTSGSAQSSGIGDIVLRAKMNFYDGEYGALASRLDFYAPTGDPDNFRGFGQPATSASLVYSAALGIFSPHLAVGFLWRFNDQNLNELRYAAGADLRITEWLTATADFLFNQNPQHNDVGNYILSAATGIKFNPWRRLVFSANLLWRLNEQGLRALVIPSAAVEYTFR
ncbi:MAG TPA: hypothetical protein DEP35_24595 [Deltaproteobacteria bacterium]|nr:hypothetical protein [Deltaproteobacteria bacterium]